MSIVDYFLACLAVVWVVFIGSGFAALAWGLLHPTRVICRQCGESCKSLIQQSNGAWVCPDCDKVAFMITHSPEFRKYVEELLRRDVP